jgi:hypothetical protein
MEIVNQMALRMWLPAGHESRISKTGTDYDWGSLGNLRGPQEDRCSPDGSPTAGKATSRAPEASFRAAEVVVEIGRRGEVGPGETTGRYASGMDLLNSHRHEQG